MTSLLRCIVATIACLVPLSSFAQADAPEGASSKETARAREESEALEQLVELASSSNFYLLLDPESPRLTLRLQGAVLREYQVGRVEKGTARVLFVARKTFSGSVWHGGELDPPRTLDRIVFTAPEPDASRPEGSVEVPMPPMVEEGVVVPATYRVVFQEGLELQFRAFDPKKHNVWGMVAAKAISRFRDISDVLHSRERMRIRVSLVEVDHHGLYRALPPNVSLMIQPEASLGAAVEGEVH